MMLLNRPVGRGTDITFPTTVSNNKNFWLLLRPPDGPSNSRLGQLSFGIVPPLQIELLRTSTTAIAILIHFVHKRQHTQLGMQSLINPSGGCTGVHMMIFVPHTYVPARG